MIVIKVYGGLGNQLFQYYFGQFIKKQFNKPVKFDTSWFFLQNKSDTTRELELITLGLLCENDIDNTKGALIQRKAGRIAKLIPHQLPIILQKLSFKILKLLSPYYHIHEISYDQVYKVAAKNAHVVFEGYWQDDRFIEKIDIDIAFEKLIEEYCQVNNRFKEIYDIINTSESVSLHIRRGDYLTGFNKSLFAQVKTSYYEQAIKMMCELHKDSHYFIFSDDIKWVENFFILPQACFVTGMNVIEDFLLMYSCKRHIISNSTFSWWAARAKKHQQNVVIMPDSWFKGNKAKSSQLRVKEWKVI